MVCYMISMALGGISKATMTPSFPLLLKVPDYQGTITSSLWLMSNEQDMDLSTFSVSLDPTMLTKMNSKSKSKILELHSDLYREPKVVSGRRDLSRVTYCKKIQRFHVDLILT